MVTCSPVVSLFPYTTLFRSFKRPGYQDGTVESKWRGEPDVAMNAAINHGVIVAFQGAYYLFGGTSASSPEFAGLVDRKSTRLNSSHVAISYAVFCLIKKISK